MGNTWGVKIKSVEENETIRALTFMSRKYHILPYVYYISKINDLSVELFSKNQIVKCFSIYNIITKKEYNISTEYMQADAFLKGIEYESCEFPTLKQILLISNVAKGSISDFLEIQKEEMILLGNKTKYFTLISDVVQDIQNEKEEFIFYNFKKDYIVIIDFKQKKKEIEGKVNLEVKGLGFECQEISLANFIHYYYNYEEEKQNKKDEEIVNNTNGLGVVHGMDEIEKKAKGLNEKVKNQSINKEDQKVDNTNTKEKNIIQEDKKDENNKANVGENKNKEEANKIIENSKEIPQEKKEITNENVKEDKKAEIKNESSNIHPPSSNLTSLNELIISQPEIKESNKNNEHSQIHGQEESKLPTLNDLIESHPQKNIFEEEPEVQKEEKEKIKELTELFESPQKNEEKKVNETQKINEQKAGTAESENIKKEKSNIQPIIKEENIEKKSENSNEQNDNLIPKEKYKKELPIYSKIDLNYNYIKKNENSSSLNLLSNDSSNICLIKSVPLETNLSVLDIYQSLTPTLINNSINN